MSGVKTALKAAKAAFDAGQFDDAISKTAEALVIDPKNYNAKLLLGRAQEKKGLLNEAEATYRSATLLKPDDFQAWSGLCSCFAAQGSKNVDAYIEASTRLAQIFAVADDKERCQTAVNKVVDFVRKQGTPSQLRRALSLMLPDSPLYETLEGRVPHPSHTYTRIVESLEAEEQDRIASEIAQERTRLGAKLSEVTLEVKRAVYGDSTLEGLYTRLINWLTDDDVRHQYEEKLLQHKYDFLLVSPTEFKTEKLNEVLDIAEGMVIIHHPFLLAWSLVLESRDVDNLQELDVNILREYIQFFPDIGPSKVLKAWLHSDLSPFGAPSQDSAEKSKDLASVSPEDRLLMLTEGLSTSIYSPFAHRLAADYFLHLDEFETAMQTARDGIEAAQTECRNLGLTLQNTQDAINSVLGTSLVSFQAPRFHAEAKRLLEDILSRKPRFTSALLGLGLIFEEMQEYQDAITFLQQALDQDVTNVRIAVELAWCKALNGDHATAQSELEAALPHVPNTDPKSRSLRAQCLYRIGACIWNQDCSRAARKDRTAAYARFLAAIKSDVEFAPAYTSLGYYYQDYAKDKKRARQCFQKGFELSSAETDAAEQLARAFADQGEWEIVEVVARRVIESGRARPSPGSKRKGLSWPYSALGVAQMNKLEYQQATVSFLAALRISPYEFQAYVGLGESYHNSGRYHSAARTFQYALETVSAMHGMDLNETWFARYMLANVHRELGDFDEAIAGLQAVLAQRSNEFGVLSSLLQTYIEKAWRCIGSALFGQSIESARLAIDTAAQIIAIRPQAFNLWKGVGDACMIFCSVQSRLKDFPVAPVQMLLTDKSTDAGYDLLSEDDGIRFATFEDHAADSSIKTALFAGILAFKRAIQACAADRHAQAVAWYNLGWAEHQAYTTSERKAGRAYLRSAVKCFKKAIELEAGNAEFWNALGIITTTLNPSVAQHAFVRSLHINEFNVKVWVNLGVLYLLQNDFELAQQAFGRAQSTDPDYAHAWIGVGLLDLLAGRHTEALNHFTHAFDISDSRSVITKMHYTTSSFDMLLSTPSASNDLASLIQPLYALEQLQMQIPSETAFKHLAALFLERVASYTRAIEMLQVLCDMAEAEYESSETLTALSCYAHAKTDLARCQLADGEYENAVENAETALDLSSDEENSGLETDARRRLRLSCHLTAGLAYNLLGETAKSINVFRTALLESEGDPDVVDLLVQVLWADGGTAKRAAARDQLFDVVEKHPNHVRSVTLLGAIAALDTDNDTMAAVKDDLISLRTVESLSLAEVDKIETLFSAFAALDPAAEREAGMMNAAQVAVMLSPTNNTAWTELAELSGDAHASQMALLTAQREASPGGAIDAATLSAAFALCGGAGDSQRAIALAPWNKTGWDSLVDAVDIKAS